jgi:hypothetical protein
VATKEVVLRNTIVLRHTILDRCTEVDRAKVEAIGNLPYP